MKVISINLGNAGSTGSIARNIKNLAVAKGITVYTAYPGSGKTRPMEKSDIIIGGMLSTKISRRLAMMTGYNGCFAFFSTLRFLNTVRRIHPDVIHLHNLHHSFINLPLLFGYIRRSGVRVIWTLHDCWAFTGQCPHFTMNECEKWKTGCFNCSQIHLYPEAYVDRTRLMWKKKRKWFSDLPDLILVTPSQWLANLTRESFLKNYPVRVINNGIDTSLFRPVESSWRETHDCEGKYIVLGVAFDWGERKGYDVFLRLAEQLPVNYQVVLVGNVDTLPMSEKIIYVSRTHSQNELAEIYSCADVLGNPTREDNFPTVNIEALACGTPIVTFQTGGSPEIPDSTSGIVVDCNDYDGFYESIVHVCEDRPFPEKACIHRASQFTTQRMLNDYIDLYMGK